MEIYATRPWAPLSAAQIQEAACLLIPGAERAPQVHRVPAQSELVQAPNTAGTKGISGFIGKDMPLPSMQGTVVRGVPPRGRPV